MPKKHTEALAEIAMETIWNSESQNYNTIEEKVAKKFDEYFEDRIYPAVREV